MKYFIIGGAGFIGSHLVKTLLKEEKNVKVVVYDNFSSGKMQHFDEFEHNPNLKIIRDDVKNKENLNQAMAGADVVYHLASNPDISKAVTQPDIDFWEGTYLTNNVLEAMRINGIKRLLYASGSGVYGDVGLIETEEDYSPLLPISTYGASKLSCEALICAYCHLFGLTANIFRFANVVGPHQTHGVGYDFVRQLMSNPRQLQILGDGTQSKSYIYISDVISAMKILKEKAPDGFSCYNVATLDYITVTAIADIIVSILGLKDVKYKYTGGNRGWKGDVPVVRLNSNRIRSFGWANTYSTKEAIYNSVNSICEDAKHNKS
ncbi:NAD-dependent epimerase/dehydratase family protein [Candidatus Omnitrophota bacterium]